VQHAAEVVQHAVAALASGGMIVVTADKDRENERDLVLSAELASDKQLAFLVRYTAGIVCVPMPGERCDELRLPQMVNENPDVHATAFTVSVDHNHTGTGTGTGTGAADRATTVCTLAAPHSRPEHFRRPGNVSRCAPGPAEY